MKKRIAIVLIILITILAIVTIGIYIGNKDVRKWIDKNIMKKEIEEQNLPTLEIDSNDDIGIHAYGKYIAIVQDNKLKIYNDKADKVNEINMQITNALFCNKGNYLLIADKDGQNLYLIYNETLQWKKTLEGNITKIEVNESGAVGVSISGTTYKSVIIMYDITGTECFRRYLSTNTATDLSISGNNKYLSFVEISTSGTLISSMVKTIQIDKVEKQPEESMVNQFEFEQNELVMKIKYSGENLIALTDIAVYNLKDNEKQELYKIENETNFVDINLNNSFYYLKEEATSLLNSKYNLAIVNVNNKKSSAYEGNNSVKNIYCSEKTIGINLGNEIQFINTSGWLVKEILYVKNIKNIVIGNSVAGIIYKDRVDIVKI